MHRKRKKDMPRWHSIRREKTYVVAGEVVDGGLGQHGVVLELRLAERGAVAGNEDKLSCRHARTEYRNKGGIVSTRDLLSLTLQSPERELGEGTHLCRNASA